MGIYERTVNVLANTFCLDKEEISFETPLEQCDSLDLLQLGFELEDEFGVELTASDFQNIKTVGELAARLEKHDH